MCVYTTVEERPADCRLFVSIEKIKSKTKVYKALKRAFVDALLSEPSGKFLVKTANGLVCFDFTKVGEEWSHPDDVIGCVEDNLSAWLEELEFPEKEQSSKLIGKVTELFNKVITAEQPPLPEIKPKVEVSEEVTVEEEQVGSTDVGEDEQRAIASGNEAGEYLDNVRSIQENTD